MKHDTQFGIENDTWPSQVYPALPEYSSPTHSVLSVSPFQSLHDLSLMSRYIALTSQ
jgi:hypothetical protein